MSSLINMEFVQALNPLYAFPIVAVILCAFIVYAFGFKSPVQPPSFDGIEEEKKITRKRKAKDTTKQVKVIQNGKLNGSASKQAQVSPSNKKSEKAAPVAKIVEEKSVSEKKTTKKSKQSNEKKASQEKKKEAISPIHEDAGEDGWVQLVSKKGRKSRKKDEAVATESQAVTKPHKNAHIDKSVQNVIEAVPSEEIPAKTEVSKKTIPEKKEEIKNEAENFEVPRIENSIDKVIIIETDSILHENSLKKAPLNEQLQNLKNEETSKKSKKKKKKDLEVANTENECIITPFESPAVQDIPETPPSPPKLPQKEAVVAETAEVITGHVQDTEPTEIKSSNVVFDELAGLYPKEKEKKKKKVRRDH